MISAGGSALPCDTPSSDPMPSWRMRDSSSTSNSRPTSAAIARARSARSVGVIILAGSLTSSRVKFCASPRILPRSNAARAESGATRIKASRDFASLDGLWRSGSKLPKIAPSTAASAFASPRNHASFFTPFCLSARTAVPTARRKTAAIEFIFLPTARYREALGLEPLGLVQDRQFACFAGEFAGGAQFADPLR